VSHPRPDELALAALPAETAGPTTLTHLITCDDCRVHVEALRRTVELARAGGDMDADAAPPPRVWEAIARETGIAPEPDRAVAPPPPARRSRWRPLAVAAAALAVGVAGGLGLGVALRPAAAPAAGSVVPLAAVAPGTSTTGTAGVREQDGTRELVIDLAGPAEPGGDYLEAWLMDASSTRLVSLGALTPQPDGHFRGSFALPAGLPTAEFGLVDVSAERWDGDPAHSKASIVRGALPPV
jgi:anti-sigma-K factor RskA